MVLLEHHKCLYAWFIDCYYQVVTKGLLDKEKQNMTNTTQTQERTEEVRINPNSLLSRVKRWYHDERAQQLRSFVVHTNLATFDPYRSPESKARLNQAVDEAVVKSKYHWEMARKYGPFEG
jgi:hypothetical protein